MAATDSSAVQVAVRVRPMLAYEAGTTKCIEVLHSEADRDPNIVRIGGESGPTFAFDQAFDGGTPQAQLFVSRVNPLVASCLEGYNATVLAYGQTGSGKTHTIMGPSTALEDGEMAGVIPRALSSLFGQLEEQKMEYHPGQPQSPESQEGDNTTYEYEVRVQFLEIYGEQIRDLLTPKETSDRLAIRDIGMEEPEVLGATQHKVNSAEDALLCLTRGMLRRVTGETAMNASSSRSHAILSVMVQQTTTTTEGITGVKRSKFNFVDLAGSERQKRTKAEGQRLKEGIDINKGLLVLGNVISALGDPKKRGKTFVPYRDSKLTRLLKGSLGGNHKTLMMACVSPSSCNLEESLNCLRYANRAKNIQNNAVVNVDAGSRMLSQLKGQLAALAKEMLRVRDGEKSNEEVFTREILEKLAAQQEGSFVGGPTPDPPLTPPRSRSGPGTPRANNRKGRRQAERQSSSSVSSSTLDLPSQRLSELEDELANTKAMLRETTQELQSTTEDVFTLRAEKETYRLRSEHGSSSNGSLEKAFAERAAAYEKEIATLKEAFTATPVEMQSKSVMERATKVLGEEKAKLDGLRSQLAHMSPQKRKKKINQGTMYDDDDDDPQGLGGESPELVRLRSKVYQSISHTDQIDAEEKAEQEELSAITSRYLPEEEQREQPEGIEEPPKTEEEKITLAYKRQELEANLLQLEQSIQEREGLIEQLQLSQRKYASMREFYEDKLRLMEDQVREREAEHAELMKELKRLETGKKSTTELRKRLLDKEQHIAGLKKRQGELVRLTKVSSRNETEISRLRQEVVSMKQKKVDLQRMITAERKSHTGEIQRLKKEVMQSDKEANKWKKLSDKKAMEAQKAQQVARQRLEQIGQLKSKYKEAERKLRVRTVKRGVMEKAGLDPVMVGRRNTSRRSTPAQRSAQNSKSGTKRNVDVDAVRDFLDQKVADVGRKEALADKVANEWEDHLLLMAQKEEILQRASKGDREVTEESIEGIDVQLKYKQERIRQLAQRLGKHSTGNEKGTEEERKNVFLSDPKFLGMFKGSTPDEIGTLSSRVLFGMVVRERRRVAALARTASTLDEKAVEADKRASAVDTAFRSYMEEHRHERASLIQSHQEQILSLMDIVREDERHEIVFPLEVQHGGVAPDAGSELSRSSSSRVMILANERIEVLERQLHELECEKETKDMYKDKEAKTRAELTAKTEECNTLRKELNQLRSSLRQIREAVSRRSVVPDQEEDDGDGVAESVLSVVMKALHPSRAGMTPKAKTTSKTSDVGMGMAPKVFSPRLKRHVELMHTSDSEEDEEIPSWAGDIMEDLAIIAEGNIPASLLGSPTFADQSAPGGRGTVFDRLTNPKNFTGTQKARGGNSKRPSGGKEKRSKQGSSKGTKNQEERKQPQPQQVQQQPPPPQQQQEQKEQQPQQKPQKPVPSTTPTTPVMPKRRTESPKSDGRRRSPSGERKRTSSDPQDDDFQGRSVFERLVSPSMYTGTQKEKIQIVQARKSQQAEQMLDDLLASDGDSIVKTDSPPSEKEVLSAAAQQELSKKVADYTQQDVFQRLQTTTTHSYAEKQKPSAPKTFSSPAKSQLEEEAAEGPRSVDLLSTSPTQKDNYTRQNVFERLQKTTTKAYAKKKSGSNPGLTRTEASVSNPETTENAVRDSVFERLQKTTTQSYAGKRGSGTRSGEF